MVGTAPKSASPPKPQPYARPVPELVNLDTIEAAFASTRGLIVMGRRAGASVAIHIPAPEVVRLIASLRYPIKPKRP